MRVTDLHVDGFGVWTELHLGELSDRVTLVFGENEAGKTTLMQFLRSVLYGFSPDRRGRYLPPVHGGRVGGVLQVDTNRQNLLILRHLEHFGTAAEKEHLGVRSGDGAVLSPALLEQLLTGVDEPTFNNVFAVGLRELQELGTLDDTDAAELLYKLTTGLDRVSLVDVMRELDAECHRLLDAQDASSQIVDLQTRHKQLRRRVGDLSATGRNWLELESRRITLTDEAQTLDRQIDELSDTLQVVEVALQTRDLWSKRSRLQRQLDRLGPVAEIPADSVQKLEQLAETVEQRRRQIEQLKRRRREIRREAALLPLDERLWSHAARIEALAELLPWIGSLQTQVEQLRGEVQVLASRQGGKVSKLDLSEDIDTDRLPDISRRSLSLLRSPARSVRDESQRHKQAEEEYETARLQCDEIVVKLESALLDQGQEDLTEAVEQAGSQVNRMRRRLQLEQRLEQMQHQRQDLRKDHGELLEDQVLSLTTLAWLGVPFVIGVMLVVGGLVWSSVASLGWPVAILGLAGWGVAVIAKISMERSAARDLAQCEKQLELLGKQIEQAQQEVADLDALLPRGGGSLEARLSAGEKELASLEDLLPLEASLQTARQRVQAARQRLDQLTAAVKESKSHWRESLRRAGLPETLSPQAVRQLAEGSAQSLQARRQLQSRREELEARESELTSLTSRIEELALTVELNYSVSDPTLLLQRLSAVAAEQQTLYQRRHKLRQEDRQIKREGESVVARLRKSRHQRRAILTEAGVKSEHDLRQVVALCAERHTLEKELAEVGEQLQLSLGKRFPLEVVESELVDHSQEQLEERYAMLADLVEQRQTQLAKIHQQQGAVVQESKTLLADRRLAEARLELGCVEQQLHEAAQRWRVLAVTAHLLETVREIYETHRQPQTLKDASRYFYELTEGQYVRIWTPLTDMSLRVDMASGESLPLDVLSCGTREAVFLSLRLALVADFARRGVELPLVLDDVLVNFDRHRARAAATVLCRFAQQGHQVLLFTCHEHIVQLFKSLQVTIRHLPHHGSLDQQLVVEPEETILLQHEIASEEPEMDERPLYEPEEVVEDEPEEDIQDEATEDSDYELEDEEEILEYDDYDHFLEDDDDSEKEEIDAVEEEEEEEEDWDEEYDDEEAATEEADEADDDEEEQFESALLDVESKEEERPEDVPESSHQRFTWESPERWWDHSHKGDAAA